MLKIQSSLIVLWHFAQFNILAIHEFFFGFGHPLSSSGKQVVNIYTSTTVRSLSSVYERKFRLRLATHMDTVTELFSPSTASYAR